MANSKPVSLPWPNKPVSKDNPLVKHLIYSLNSQPRVDLCTALGAKCPPLRAEDMLPGTSPYLSL